jgi:two-component system OmpR family response regulator
MMMEADADEPAAATLLIVDDDVRIRSLLATNLSARGYQVVTASNAAEMRRCLAQQTVDVVILDIMMPGEDGLSACRRIEAEGGPPVILLSALGEETDRILGLDSGADRYLPKPCSSQEVLAHIRAILRKRRKATEPVRRFISFSNYRVDLDSHELFNRDGALVDLSDGEFAVLRAFLTRPRRILSRNELLLAARGPDSEAFDRAIDVQVSRLRRKLKDTGGILIRTVRNEGYMFLAKISTETATPQV